MRDRKRVLDSLENVYREALEGLDGPDAERDRARLDFEFQRDQVHLEVLLDIRDLWAATPAPQQDTTEKVGGLIDTAQKLKNLTKLR